VSSITQDLYISCSSLLVNSIFRNDILSGPINRDILNLKFVGGANIWGWTGDYDTASRHLTWGASVAMGTPRRLATLKHAWSKKWNFSPKMTFFN